MGAAASMIPAAMSVGGSLYGMAQGAPSSQVQYNPTISPDLLRGTWLQQANRLGDYPGTNLGQQTIPQAQQAAAGLYNNPGAGGLVGGANLAGDIGTMAGLNAFNTGNYLTGQGQNLFGFVNPIMQAGFDPQQALYNRTLQQVQEQQRAGQSARGIGMTPFGAGLENQALSNFNIDWQNQQLQRMAQAAQAGGGLAGVGGRLGIGGQELAATAPGSLYQAGAYPYQAYSQIGQGQLGALSGLQGIAGGAQSLYGAPIAAAQGMIGAGVGANQQANQVFGNQLTQAQNAFSQNQAFGGGLGAGLQGAFGQNPYTGQSNFGNAWGALQGWGQQPSGWGMNAAQIGANPYASYVP